VASETQVAKIAATRLGAEVRFLSLGDDLLVTNTLRAVWDIERRAAIRDGSWNFAMKRFQLAAQSLSGGVPYPFAASFPLPGESLRLIEVLSPEVGTDYQLEGKSVLCNITGPLYVRCLVDVAELALWDDLAAEAFGCRLAMKCGRRIAGSNYSEQQGGQEYMAALNAAKGVDALENPPIEQEECDWILARFS